MAPENPCPHHPYFSEFAIGLGLMGLFFGAGLFVLAVMVGIGTRRLSPAGGVAATAVVMLLASLATARWGDELLMRVAFGADDWARLQRELQAREADLAQYGREHPGLTTSELVKGYLATQRSIPGFQFTDPRIEPLDFKISDWRDTVPRVVVGFGCSNNVVFNSATMTVEQSD